MNKLISILASTVSAVSAMMTTSGTIKTSADQGNKITIYYAENTWDFTKLGHINNITQEELKALLGDEDVTVSLSIQ